MWKPCVKVPVQAASTSKGLLAAGPSWAAQVDQQPRASWPLLARWPNPGQLWNQPLWLRHNTQCLYPRLISSSDATR